MATINYNSGNINVSFFPSNVNPIWFCDKNTGGINIATNGAEIIPNTTQIENWKLATNYLGTFAGTTEYSLFTDSTETAVNTKGTLSFKKNNVTQIAIDANGIFDTLGKIVKCGTVESSGVVKTTAVESSAATSSLTIGNNITTSFIGIGAGVTSGNVGIMTGNNTAGQVFIGSNGLANGGSVAIGSGLTNATGSYISLGSETLPYNYIRGRNVNINSESINAGVSNSVYIGTDAFTTSYIKGNIQLGASGGTGTVTVNRPLTIGYAPSAVTTNQIGYSIKYTFSGPGGTLTLASFTNTPIGIYLLTVGPTTIYDFVTAGPERADINFTTTTGIESFTSFTPMENSGTTAEKLGVCFSMPIRVVNATNQLTINLAAIVGGYQTTGGSSCLTRIA